MIFTLLCSRKCLKSYIWGFDFEGFNPNDTCSYSFSTVESLIKCFPQLGLDDSASINALRDELMDFKLSPAERPANEVGKLNGELRFPSLVKLMVGLLVPQTPTLKGDFPCCERFTPIRVQP